MAPKVATQVWFARIDCGSMGAAIAAGIAERGETRRRRQGEGRTAMDGGAGGVAVWWIAIAALVLGGIGAALGLSGRRRHRTLGEQLLRIEEASRNAREREGRRARLRASIEQEVTVGWYLTIRNEGHAAAQDFTVSIDGSALDRCPLIDPQALDLARTGTVGAHAAMRIPLKPGAAPDKLQLELTWSDASGEMGFYEAELSR